jgi:maltose O-acetyltransferase
MGADIEPAVTVHGGTYVTRPANLRIGHGTFFNRNCYLDLEGVLTIGRNVTVGHGTTFITAYHEIGPAEKRCAPSSGLPIEVGDGAWVGANVTILPGVVVGRGAVVGAGAVVVHDVPENAVVAGSPARVRRVLA